MRCTDQCTVGQIYHRDSEMHDSLPTVGEIARRLGVPLHKIEYVIRSRQIRPVSVAGNSRVFSDQQVSRIANELQRIADEREVSIRATPSQARKE